jgi:hypothetical protein
MGANATSSKAPARSASSYGLLSDGTPTALGSDLTQVGFACDPSGDFPCPSGLTGESYNSILIVGLTNSALPNNTQVTIDLPSGFDGVWALFNCSTAAQIQNFGYPLCTPITPNATACDAAGNLTSADVFVFTVTPSCSGSTFVFDESTSDGSPQLASLATTTATTPEPDTLAMLGVGMLLLGGALKRRLQV